MVGILDDLSRNLMLIMTLLKISISPIHLCQRSRRVGKLLDWKRKISSFFPSGSTLIWNCLKDKLNFFSLLQKIVLQGLLMVVITSNYGVKLAIKQFLLWLDGLEQCTMTFLIIDQNHGNTKYIVCSWQMCFEWFLSKKS